MEQTSAIIDIEELPPKILCNIQSMSDQQIEEYRDDRGWKLQHIAAFWGDLVTVNKLIRLGIDFEEKIEGKTATEWAFERGHFEVVLELLKTEYRFPTNFNKAVATDSLKSFADLCDSLHASIKNENTQEIDRILTSNLTLVYFYNSSVMESQSQEITQKREIKYFKLIIARVLLLIFFVTSSIIPRQLNFYLTWFYSPFRSKQLHFYKVHNIQNKSALRTALEHRKFDIYENLHRRGLSFAPNENFQNLKAELSMEEKNIIRKIHTRLSKTSLTKPIATLCKNSNFGLDCPDEQEHKNFINEAYNYLYYEAGLDSVLNTVVASRNFTIVYDFSRSAIDYIDPKAQSNTNGASYSSSGEIYIAAKDMLDPVRKFEIFGVIAHELTHYAMYLTYNNRAEPYFKKDETRFKEFARVLMRCKILKDEEKLIRLVFYYDRKCWRSELIVRVPHMMAQYHNQPDVLAERRETFKPLFDFFEQNCVSDMERVLTNIRKKFRSEKEKKIAKQRKIIKIGTLCFGLVFLIGFLIGFWFYLESFYWENLSEKSKLKIHSTPVSYLNCDVKFGDILPENPDVHNKLSCWQILGALWGVPFKFPKVFDKKWEKYVRVNSSELPKCLENKLLSSNVSFQGHNMTIFGLLMNKSRAFELLESKQTVQILNGQKLFEVSKQVEQKSKFFVEREFADEECLKKKEGVWLKGEDSFKCVRISTLEILSEIENSKMFFLSSPAGEGKSTTFRHFGLKLKEKWPQKWVEFVDLKEHLKDFKIGSKLNFTSAKVLETFLGEILLNLSGFERIIFNEKFQNGDAIFLWDGIDEITPIFKEFFLDLTSKFSNLTENWQFSSTRPKHTEEFKNISGRQAFGLAPLDKQRKHELIVKFHLLNQTNLVVSEIQSHLNFSLSIETILMDLRNSKLLSSFNEIQIEKIVKQIEKSEKIITSIEMTNERNRLVHENVSPLLIEMVIEAAKNENFTILQNFNSFWLYDSFVDQRMFDITFGKGEVVMEDLKKWIKSDEITFKEAHQAFALNEIYFFDRLFDTTFSKDLEQFFNKKIAKVLKNNEPFEISRFGILTVNSEEDFDFVHRTFAEFFIAKFLINNLIKTPNLDPENIKTSIYLLNAALTIEIHLVVRNFLTDFLDSNQDDDAFDFAKYFSDCQKRKEKLEKITNIIDIEILLTTVDVSFYFIEKFNISKQLIVAIALFFEFDYSNLMSQWENLLLIFGQEKMNFVLEICDGNGRNLLFNFCFQDYSVDLLLEVLQFYENKTLNQTQLKEMFFNKQQNENLLMAAVDNKDVEFFEILRNFTNKHFNSEELKEILKMEDTKNKMSILEFARANENVETFQYLSRMYNETLTREEIKKLILSFDEEFFPVSFIAANFYQYFANNEVENTEVCIEVANFLFELFDISTLRNLFERRAEKYLEIEGFSRSDEISKDETILSYIQKSDEECFEFYKRKWQNILENETFEEDFNQLFMSKSEDKSVESMDGRLMEEL